VTPSLSILAQPSVAIVDENVDEKGTREVATAYLEYLYSDIGQKLAGDNYYRPSNPDILANYSKQFNLDINLITIDDPLFGGWEKVHTDHFSDGAVFDQIYEE
jgi:sulfate transport system substrate-binding protein